MATGRPSLAYQAIITLLAGLMVFALISSLSGFWRIFAPSGQLVAISAAAVALAWVLWRSPSAGVTLIIAAAAVLLLETRARPEWAQVMRTLLVELGQFGESLRSAHLEATFGPLAAEFLLGLQALGAGLLIVREALARGNTFWSIAAGTVVFGTEWVWYYDPSLFHFVVYVLLALVLWVLSQAARREALWAASGRYAGHRSRVMVPVAWVMAATLLAAALPAQFDPVDLGGLGELLQEAIPVLGQLRGSATSGFSGRFSLRTTGFAPVMGSLGGPVKLDNRVALLVRPDQPLQETTYLRGATFLQYDGRSWKPGDLPLSPVSPSSPLPSNWGSDLPIHQVHLKVSPAADLGHTIFHLWEPVRVEGLTGGIKADADGNLWADKAIPQGSTYEVYARWPTYSAEQIRLVSKSQPSDQFKPYLQLPGTLPKRVGEVARSIAAEKTHPYDQAVELESFFRGMRYDLDVPSAPPGRDFVDFFLFDLKRGYCTYYASAMTVMLRELAIPSRLVEGFALPAASTFAAGETGQPTYSVLNSQAHAWVEAYFPDYGWVTFDPTPRADLPVIDRSAPAPHTQVDTTTPKETTTPPSTEQQANQPRQDMARADEPNSAQSDGPRSLPTWSWAVVAAAVAAALLGLLAVGYRRLRAQTRIVAVQKGEVVQEVWSKAAGLMGLFGFGRKPSQTALEYANTLGQDWPSLKEPATRVAQDYTRSRYAPEGQPTHSEAAGRARKFWRTVQSLLFSRYGWRHYLWRRLKWQNRS